MNGVVHFAVADVAIFRCRTECQQAIADLRSVTPQLFVCACSMKRPEIRDKCARIRSRLAGNACLGESMRIRDVMCNADSIVAFLVQPGHVASHNFLWG